MAYMPGFKSAPSSERLSGAKDPAAVLGDRIEAARALAQIGNTRTQHQVGPHGKYIIPFMVAIRGGEYMVGGASMGCDDTLPGTLVQLEAFSIGCYPVTNAEFELFCHARCYEQSRWWTTAAGEAWRSGSDRDEGAKDQWRDYRRDIREKIGQVDELLTTNQISEHQVSIWKAFDNMDDETFEAWLGQWCQGGGKCSPRYWNEPGGRCPSQPVVGISWHEARAYCEWLSANTASRYDLPSEAEWEAAARGLERRRYPWGNEPAPNTANTAEAGIGAVIPVGLFTAGATPEGCMDMIGNVWEWTTSLHRPYPYQPVDGREDLQTPITGPDRRVTRGGSYPYTQQRIDSMARNDCHPNTRAVNIGFRVMCRGEVSGT